MKGFGVTEEWKRIQAKVANNQTISFMSNTFTVGLESMDGGDRDSGKDLNKDLWRNES